jgi:hypothetical protein
MASCVAEETMALSVMAGAAESHQTDAEDAEPTRAEARRSMGTLMLSTGHLRAGSTKELVQQRALSGRLDKEIALRRMSGLEHGSVKFLKRLSAPKDIMQRKFCDGVSADDLSDVVHTAINAADCTAKAAAAQELEERRMVRCNHQVMLARTAHRVTRTSSATCALSDVRAITWRADHAAHRAAHGRDHARSAWPRARAHDLAAHDDHRLHHLPRAAQVCACACEAAAERVADSLLAA